MLKSCRKYLVVGIASLFFLSTSAYAQVIDVTIDVKPQSCPNPLNAKKKGVIPVAISGISFGGDEIVLANINVASLTLNGVPAKPGFVVADVTQPLNSGSGEGTNSDPGCAECWEYDLAANQGVPYPGDGFLDLVLHFDAQAVIDTLLPTSEVCHELQLAGEMLNGDPILGTDFIRLLQRGRNQP